MLFHDSLTVLVVDAHDSDGECSCRMLNAPHERSSTMRTIKATTLSDALAMISAQPVDVVLLDPSLVDTSLLDAVCGLRHIAPDLPIVIAADTASEAVAFEAVQAGAQDYVIKGVDDARVLHRALRHAVERAALARARERAERRASFLADAGAQLGASLDARTTLATATRLAVPALGECAVGIIVNEDDSVQPVDAACSSHPDCEHLMAAARAAATGSDVVVPLHGMILPLRARGRVLGVLGLIMPTGTHHREAADLALVDAFATRIATAMDNARLYEASRRATRTRDQVLGIVSHDLRNPLSAIGMCAAALRDDIAMAPSERQRLVGTIRDAVDWTQRLLADLLDIASIEAEQLSVDPRPVDPIVVISRALDLFELRAEGRVVQLAADVPDWLPTIMGDAQRILQVLANLIGNALKFTPPHGRITLGAEARANAVAFTVSDTGPGIAPAHVPHIFDWFWRASHERAERGTGLGLAIAKGIVDAHGGRMTVESTPGNGATFSFTIPQAGPSLVWATDPAAQAERVPA